MQPKKALFVTSVWGFLAKFEERDVRMLQQMGYEVHYASNQTNPIFQYPADVYEKMGVIYHDTGIWQSPFGIQQNLAAVKQVRRIIQSEQIQLVHCHTPTGGMVARLAAQGTGARVIYTVHGFHFYRGAGWKHNLFYHGIERFLSRMTDLIVTINTEDYEAACRLRQRMGTYRIPGAGLDRDYFSFTDEEEREKARKKLGMENAFFLVQVGEIRENKNPAAIIKALSILKNSGTDIGQFRYGLVGAGKQTEELQELIRELKLEEQVIFYGYQEDVRSYVRAADLMTFPSIREGLGMAALEALAMGIPVLAADNRGTREYMKPEINGYVCASNQPEEYAGWLMKMYRERSEWAENPEKRKEIRATTEAFACGHTEEIMRQVYERAEH